MRTPDKISDVPPPIDTIGIFDEDGGYWLVRVNILKSIAAKYDAALARRSGKEEGLFDLLTQRARILKEHLDIGHEVGFGIVADSAATNQIIPVQPASETIRTPEPSHDARPPETELRVFKGEMTTKASLEFLAEKLGATLTNVINIMLNLGCEVDSELANPGFKVFVRRSPGAAMIETPLE